jgi:hypothetical protein
MCDTRGVQNLPRQRSWIILGVILGATAVEAAAGYLLLRYVFHASLWWLLSLFPVLALGLWTFWHPASALRFSKKLEEVMNVSPNFPRNFFP